MRTLTLILTFVACSLITVSQTGYISNINPSQRTDGSMIIDIYYDLTGSLSDYTVTAKVTFDGGDSFHPVDSLNGDAGKGITPGNAKHIIWSFGAEYPGQYSNQAQIRLTASQPPEIPFNPTPIDGALDIDRDTVLAWQCSDPDMGVLTYDIYFGDNANPPLVSTSSPDTFYTPGTLDYSTQYFWRVIAYDNHGDSTHGPVWSFITKDWQCGGDFVDDRDGKTYSSVEIGSQCWMGENLNVGIMIGGGATQHNNSYIEKWCGYNDLGYCDEYGGLYQWDEAMGHVSTPGTQGICPNGWHLPTDLEWCTMEQFLDNSISCSESGWRGVDCGGKLKEAGTDHWLSPNTGATNSSGFTAFGSGVFYAGSGFQDPHESVIYRTSSESSSTYSAWVRRLTYNEARIACYTTSKNSGFSVRCVKD